MWGQSDWTTGIRHFPILGKAPMEISPSSSKVLLQEMDFFNNQQHQHYPDLASGEVCKFNYQLKSVSVG